MGRLLFAKGAVGEIVRTMQTRLGLPAVDVDGWFGGQTETAVTAFQGTKGLAQSGEVDLETWTQLMAEPIPDIRQRSLQLTAHFEGHDFTLAQGNFDGAGITWGIIGFTLSGGELGKIVRQIHHDAPDLLDQAFGSLVPTLLDVVNQPSWPAQLAFADSISLGKKKTRLAEPWLTSFARFGELPAVQALQLDRSNTSYYEPALKTAAKLGLVSELGIALAFDVHVQNGGIKKSAAAIKAALADKPPPTEPELRVIVANAVAAASAPKWQHDVRARKMAIATGSGTVHEAKVVLRNWGLQELPA